MTGVIPNIGLAVVDSPFHSPTRNPMEAKKATMPIMVEKWQALDSIFMTHTSMFFSCRKNHPDEETHPKTMMAKNRVQTRMQTMGLRRKVRGSVAPLALAPPKAPWP